MTTPSRSTTLDLEPATTVLAAVVSGVRDDQLNDPTPCADTSVGDLVDHTDGLAQGFIAAAHKTPLPEGSRAPTSDGSHLAADWRTRIPERLAELAEAWRDENAWTGMTQAGGIDLPGNVAGLVAINEVLVHGWDISVATGQPLAVEPALVHAAMQFVQASVAENPNGTPGLFGPPVPVPDEASPLERLLGLTGRDPGWHPA